MELAPHAVRGAQSADFAWENLPHLSVEDGRVDGELLAQAQSEADEVLGEPV
ncbi:MAG: hypothetical protein AAF089_18645 [Bacteroidota bacterium]